MKKSDIPKPKYSLGDHVVFNVPGDGNYNPRREVGKIDLIEIMIIPSGHSIRYGFENKYGTHDETSIVRKA